MKYKHTEIWHCLPYNIACYVLCYCEHAVEIS
jgi:hypothetical protein